MRDYFSKVDVLDLNGNVVVSDFDIEVNRPLSYGGFLFYQSSVSEEDHRGIKYMVATL